jgi:hypothetical protein
MPDRHHSATRRLHPYGARGAGSQNHLYTRVEELYLILWVRILLGDLHLRSLGASSSWWARQVASVTCNHHPPPKRPPRISLSKAYVQAALRGASNDQRFWMTGISLGVSVCGRWGRCVCANIEKIDRIQPNRPQCSRVYRPVRMYDPGLRVTPAYNHAAILFPMSPKCVQGV